MRVAVSGAHFSGKSTLIASLLKKLPHYTSVNEPYYLLEGEGYEFSYPPTLEDFEAQLKCSIRVIKESQDNTFFDRCPLDCLAYAMAIVEIFSPDDVIDVEEWVQMMEDAIQKLDLIIFVPIEKRVPVPESEDLELRRNVDEKLHEMLLNDSLGILEDIEVVEAFGSLDNRASMVLQKL